MKEVLTQTSSAQPEPVWGRVPILCVHDKAADFVSTCPRDVHERNLLVGLKHMPRDALELVIWQEVKVGELELYTRLLDDVDAHRGWPGMAHIQDG